MSKNKTPKQQVKNEFEGKICFGESRHKAKAASEERKTEGIYSIETYKTYLKHVTAFGNWVKENYGKFDLKKAKIYVAKYLEERINEGLSAWTISTCASALAKIYNCKVTDFDVTLPKRKRADVVRSRNEVSGYKSEKYQDLENFAKGTGLRIHELRALKMNDIYETDGKLMVHVEKGKGGKSREAEVTPKYEKSIRAFLSQKSNNGQKVFTKKEIPSRFPAHSFRAIYACEQYKMRERDLKTLSKKEIYYCRKDKKGTAYDKQAMLEVSRLLGHNRIDVVGQSYLYRL